MNQDTKNRRAAYRTIARWLEVHLREQWELDRKGEVFRELERIRDAMRAAGELVDDNDGRAAAAGATPDGLQTTR